MRVSVVFFFLIINLSWAQAQSKGLIEARTLQAEGKLEEALTVIKNLVANEGAEDGGAWYTFAEVSRALFSQTEDFEQQSVHMTNAVKGYQETLKYQPQGTRIYLSADQSLSKMYQDLIRLGVQYYQKEAYDQALQAFENAVIIEPGDSTVITYAANAAVQGKYYDKALNNYRKLIALKPKESVYQNMISIQRDLQKDLEGALTTIEGAMSDFPDVISFGRYKLDVLLLSKQNEQALELLDQLLEKTPDDVPMNLRKAVLLDEKNKELKSDPEIDSLQLAKNALEVESAYLKTLELSPGNLVANFNLAMFYNDQANYYYSSINKMSNDEYIANAKTYEEKALALIRKALPYMEAASRKNPKDINILKTLEAYYDRLSMGDKKRAIQAKIKTLGN